MFGTGDKHGKFTNQDFVYLAFFSLTGCSILVYVSFPSDSTNNVVRTVTKGSTFMEGEDTHQTQNPATQEKKDIKEIEESLMGTSFAILPSRDSAEVHSVEIVRRHRGRRGES